ncbi:uncharacterized protein LOC133308310 [Gastrolobium bilobum]|uniref:uncharacterized protein LOC133308310 n=1 Tax=Gastrolobium bilobum TaxID=150636 RepID=UPI002AB2A3F2|nr:uncharacterized protein LOC133308310 [Gastrolobium bilobum]
MVKASEMEGVEVPEEMMDAVNRTLSSVEQLETHLPQFLSLSDPQFLSQMPYLERAHSLLSLAKLTSTLFSLKLRCRGINPNDHPVKSELDKLSEYQKKLDRLQILIEAQKQDVRNISREEELKLNYQECAGQKRKYPSSEEQSVKTEPEEFLEKTTGELLGNNDGSLKGPMVIDISDDDDE